MEARMAVDRENPRTLPRGFPLTEMILALCSVPGISFESRARAPAGKTGSASQDEAWLDGKIPANHYRHARSGDL